MSIADALRLWGGSYRRLARALLSAGPVGPRRAVALALLVPPLVLLQAMHWIGLLLDEALFRAYRRVEVVEPTFIVGMPRSGTSFLHGTLARDEDRFTTLRLWQLLFAPSITERRLWGAIARLDALIGRPVALLAAWVTGRATRGMDHVHPVALDAPEEDFLFLLPAFACFLLVAAFPTSPAVWELTRIDEWPPRERRRLLAFYRSCLRRHLYCERARARALGGPVDRGDGEPRILSKNPSFTACLATLAELFPDARFVCCFRDPAQAISSQLGSLTPAARLFGWDPADPAIGDRFVDMYERFSRRSIEVLGALPPGRACFVSQRELAEDAAGAVGRIHDAFGWSRSPAYEARLAELSRAQRDRRSPHRHEPERFGLDARALADRFVDVSAALEDLRSGGGRSTAAGAGA